MPTESVKIIIDAEDKASKKIRQTTEEIAKNVKQTKEVGEQAKASTELVGSLASTIGGAGVGAFAGEMAMLTERIRAFSEVSKAGAAGALAFKAGLVAAAAIISFKIGKALGDIVFQTKKWNEQLEAALKTSKALAAQQDAIASSRRDALGTTEEQKQAVKDQQVAARKQHEALLRQRQEQKAFDPSFGLATGALEAVGIIDNRQLDSAIEEAAERRKALAEELTSLSNRQRAERAQNEKQAAADEIKRLNDVHDAKLKKNEEAQKKVTEQRKQAREEQKKQDETAAKELQSRRQREQQERTRDAVSTMRAQERQRKDALRSQITALKEEMADTGFDPGGTLTGRDDRLGSGRVNPMDVIVDATNKAAAERKEQLKQQIKHLEELVRLSKEPAVGITITGP